MCTQEHQIHRSVTEPARKGNHGLPAQFLSRWETPALLLLAGTLWVMLSACGQQPSQDVITQINARLDQLEQKMSRLDAKDVELTELVNDGKASTIKLEENIAALAQQVEKIASRPSAPSVQKSAQASSREAQGKKYHTVARGETLYSIAKRYALTVDELCRMNNLNPGQPIQAGQKLAVNPDGR